MKKESQSHSDWQCSYRQIDSLKTINDARAIELN